MNDYIKCIHQSNGRSWCGKDIRGQWSFVDVKHAIDTEASGSNKVACKECVQQFHAAVTGEKK